MNRTGLDDPRASIAGALAWWREAGVTHVFGDEARSWLAQETPEPAPEAAALPGGTPAHHMREAGATPAPAVASRLTQSCPPLGGARAAWPADLPAFREWWLSEPSLDERAGAARIPPRGPANAALMMIVPQPEAEDAEAGALLSGPQGRLLDAMLKAMGLSPQEVYIASALPSFMDFVDWRGLAERGLGELLVHHVMLAAPRRAIAFGGNVLSLLSHDPTQNTASSPILSLEGTAVPLLPARDPGFLLDRPRARAAFWRQWLDWSA